MTILLPTRPGLSRAEPEPIRFGGWLTPPHGGEEQWIGRLGSRMQLTCQTPRLKPDPDGRLWVAALASAFLTGELVSMPFLQPWFKVGAPGAIVVEGGGQQGMVLRVRGGTSHYAIRKGQFFSLVSGGRRYLHFARGETVLNADGSAEVPIAPMLRIVPQDGDACEFGTPTIEGKVGGDRMSWTHERARMAGLAFVITETK
ncbi:hypothetical protein [Rhizorhabdus histidinilytica]|uniref:hypothetical protein n=1 Tax=Rhizorhabdus histidinilytica TaxID=439228 RepID=UPI0032201ADC